MVGIGLLLTAVSIFVKIILLGCWRGERVNMITREQEVGDWDSEKKTRLNSFNTNFDIKMELHLPERYKERKKHYCHGCFIDFRSSDFAGMYAFNSIHPQAQASCSPTDIHVTRASERALLYHLIFDMSAKAEVYCAGTNWSSVFVWRGTQLKHYIILFQLMT